MTKEFCDHCEKEIPKGEMVGVEIWGYNPKSSKKDRYQHIFTSRMYKYLCQECMAAVIPLISLPAKHD